MYCKAPVKYVNGKKTYGNLPPGTVVAYDIDGFGYFKILTDEKFPPNSDVMYISEADYNLAIDTLNQQVAQKRQQEEEAVTQMLARREQRMADIEIMLADIIGK